MARTPSRFIQWITSIVKQYDPAVAPSPLEWLALDEQERLLLVQRYHERAKIELPNVKAHAVFHTVVENQLAEGVPEVIETFERLRGEGLERHDVVHAIGSVLAQHMSRLMREGRSDDPNRAYFRELRRLTASRWRAS